jgi:superfamily II DNA/RNA helicase
MQFSARSVKDLLFLFPPSATEHRNTQRTIQSIPKTIIFFRSTDQLLNARFQLVKTLASRYSIPAKAAKRIVQAFYSHRSEFSKREIHAWFLDDNSEVRILAATDAVGMGMDFPNVEVCIQFDVPDNVDILLQRLGRTGRNPKLKAYFVWFIPSKLLKESSDVQSTTTTPGQEELQLDEEQDENNADDHSYRAQPLSDREETASEGSQIGDDDDVDLE